MVCQNQNLAESEAPLAVDMKEKIRDVALNKKYLNACDYCPGNDRMQLPAGIQLKREKKQKKISKKQPD